ncbi:MAG: hypothetical protein JXA07_16740 [Spirochaetes bacterium]|nr:hypothetical protein [Spirochaetota bacterium]
MHKKALIFIAAFALILAQGRAGAQEYSPSKDRAGAQDEQVTRDDRIPPLYKRLVAALQSLKLKPDEEGKHTFIISSGNQYDHIDRIFLVYSKKARVYMSQNRISKIVFEYYQFNMTSKVREVKTYVCETPDSDDLSRLTIEYSTNTGEKEKYAAGELQRKESQRIIVRQYYSYLFSLVNKMELYKNKTVRLESSKINRTILLGD